MRSLFNVVCLGLGLLAFACGEDTPAAKVDQGAATSDLSGKIDQSSVDQGGLDTGQSQPDQAVIDQAVALPDLARPQPLTTSHQGWQTAGCAGASCHTLPITEAGHLNTTSIADCSSCHGGNGACDPDGTHSGKKNHNSGSTCTMCHQNQHGAGFNSKDCQACHYAAAGVVDCP